MDLLITILLIVFAVWLVGVFFGWFQTSVAGGPRNLLFLLLAILLVILLLREFGLFTRRGRLFCVQTLSQSNLVSELQTNAVHDAAEA